MVTWSGERADRLPVGRYLTPVSDMSERAPEATVPAARNTNGGGFCDAPLDEGPERRRHGGTTRW